MRVRVWLCWVAAEQVRSREGKFMTMLLPTPELWTLSLPHRTQIVHTADISHVVLRLNIVPGSVVVESGEMRFRLAPSRLCASRSPRALAAAGTGSGSLTTSLARAVAPSGHVHTFEFNGMRAEVATYEWMLRCALRLQRVATLTRCLPPGQQGVCSKRLVSACDVHTWRRMQGLRQRPQQHR